MSNNNTDNNTNTTIATHDPSSSSSLHAVVDHLSKRVVLTGSLGALGGALHALHRGHSRLPRTAALTGFSCALVATITLSVERLVYQVITLRPARSRGSTQNPSSSASNPDFFHRRTALLLSHGTAGIVGGGYVGQLYLNRPVRGMIFFTPLLLLLGFGEYQYQVLQHKIKQQQSPEEVASSTTSDENNSNRTNPASSKS